MDIYLPACGDESHLSQRPLMMWIHGGSFISGDKDEVNIQTMCKEFAKRGYVTASINYRLGFISDEANWQCNYPSYNCLFATDSVEWIRAYYRAVQDGKGELRYLINRSEEYRIDHNNIFIAGESAGAFIALGAGLMDSLIERPLETFAVSDAPLPHPASSNCNYNLGINFSGETIPRPDLGGIDGTIEMSEAQYTIKGIGNIYGAMFDDLLKYKPIDKPKPAIYSFHQPCDIIVPIDSNYVYWGLSWCFANGYDCNQITNNKNLLYGSRAFSDWNIEYDYGYDVKNEFTNVDFPYHFIFGQGSCLDQVNNPCYAYDDRSLRENNLALFFSDKITSSAICDTTSITSTNKYDIKKLEVFPNPMKDILYIIGSEISELDRILIFNSMGRKIALKNKNRGSEILLYTSELSQGVYILNIIDKKGAVSSRKVVKM